MKHTTLCYIERDDRYLMLHRVKKQNDENHDKWIGIGGKLEPGESPHDCVRREITEETGLVAQTLCYRGFITFVSDTFSEYMHLFTCPDFSGTLRQTCEEGELAWIEKRALFDLTLWEGDRIFLSLLENERRFFSLKLVYRGETLISHTLEFADGDGLCS